MQTQSHETSAPTNPGTIVGPNGAQTQRTLNDWWAAGTALLWVPIIDVDGSADSLAAAHELAAELDGGWLIHRPDDLMTLPEGIKGWLLPLDAEDTDIVCGRWEREVTFMQVIDRRTGARVTFRTDVEAPVVNDEIKPEAEK